VAGDYEFFLRELTANRAHFMYDLVVSRWTPGGVSSAPENCLPVKKEDARPRQLNGIFPYPPVWW
jgi:hypothetical protein